MKKICEWQFKFFVNYAWYIVTLMYYCVSIIKVLEKNLFKKLNNYWMLYKIFFESLIDLWSNIHIRVSYKWMHEMMQLYKLFVQESHASLMQLLVFRSISWEINHTKTSKSWDLKQRSTRKMILLLNDLVSFCID